MTLPFYTIGHSNRIFDYFYELLNINSVQEIVDVRKIPGSKSNPQFNELALEASLSEHGLRYRHVAALGGFGKKSLTYSEVNAFWENQSFHNYADYALTEEFRTGLDELINLGARRTCAIMCSEAVWWRCHRRLIADNLIACGLCVFHIMEKGHLQPARLTTGAKIQPDGSVHYPSRMN